MFFVSFGLMLIHVVFTAIWLLFFSRVFLIGHIESTTLTSTYLIKGLPFNVVAQKCSDHPSNIFDYRKMGPR